MNTGIGLTEALANGGTLVVAEGYMWEIERRGYLQLGNYLPEVVLDHPEVVRQLHEEFAHAGSDVIEAFTVSVYSPQLRNISFAPNVISVSFALNTAYVLDIYRIVCIYHLFMIHCL